VRRPAAQEAVGIMHNAYVRLALVLKVPPIAGWGK
jgi:hypothetical protein